MENESKAAMDIIPEIGSDSVRQLTTEINKSNMDLSSLDESIIFVFLFFANIFILFIICITVSYHMVKLHGLQLLLVPRNGSFESSA